MNLERTGDISSVNQRSVVNSAKLTSHFCNIVTVSETAEQIFGTVL